MLEIAMAVHFSANMALFIISGQFLSCVFKSIQKQISPDANFLLLLNAMRSYTVAYETVDAINNCFGWIFLTTTQFSFVGLINISFNLFGTSDFVLVDLILFFDHFIYLVAMCWTADSIRQQVFKNNMQQNLFIVTFIFFKLNRLKEFFLPYVVCL